MQSLTFIIFIVSEKIATLIFFATYMLYTGRPNIPYGPITLRLKMGGSDDPYVPIALRVFKKK